MRSSNIIKVPQKEVKVGHCKGGVFPRVIKIDILQLVWRHQLGCHPETLDFGTDLEVFTCWGSVKL